MDYIINRKNYKLVLLTLLVFVLSGCADKSTALKKDYKIKSGQDIVMYTSTDLHYLSKSLTDNGEAFNKFISSGDGKQLRYMDEILDAFTSTIKATKPHVLIISGDLTNNGEKQSHLDLAKKLKTIEKSGTSVYVIPGNHDILNPYARGFKGDKQYVTEYVDDKDFSKIYAEFGYKEAISKDTESLSYLVAPSEELWILMLDTNEYKYNVEMGFPNTDGELSSNTLNWIKECSALAKQNGANLITVMHHNILHHSEVIQKGFTLDNNEEALEVFKDNNLNLVLSGHIHIQDICSKNIDKTSIFDIASNSLAIYPHQYGVIKYTSKDKSVDYDTTRVDVESWSKDKGITDKNLNNFEKYSEEYFGKFAYDMVLRQFNQSSKYSDKEIKAMAETMKILNLRYFADTEYLNSKDVVNSEGYKLLISTKDGFLKNYIMSITSDKNVDENSLHIQIGN